MATSPIRRSTVLALLALVVVPVGLGSLEGCAPTAPSAAPPLKEPELDREEVMPPVGDDAFTEVTRPAGIRTRHRLPTPDLYNIVDAVGAGAAFADLNGDDLLDTATTCSISWSSEAPDLPKPARPRTLPPESTSTATWATGASAT